MRGKKLSFLQRRDTQTRPAFTSEVKYSKGIADGVITVLGVALGLTCALFPWYIFFNQEKFGIQQFRFERQSADAQPMPPEDEMQASKQPELVATRPELDPLPTGTLASPDRPAASSGDQAFPSEGPPFRLVHVASGRAMIADDAGLFVVGVGSVLPDNSRVAALEQREGRWVLVTSRNNVVELDP